MKKFAKELIKGIKESQETEYSDIIKLVEQYSPEPVYLPEFDMARKHDHVYCVEWGMTKAQRNEYKVYQKMLTELKLKYRK